jgi:hypothetical protein
VPGLPLPDFSDRNSLCAADTLQKLDEYFSVFVSLEDFKYIALTSRLWGVKNLYSTTHVVGYI